MTLTAELCPKTSDAAGRACVLIAEDDADFRLLLREYIKRAGYSVIEAANGHAAFERMSMSVRSPGALRPDLIVMDVLMPGVSGFDAAMGLKLAGFKVPIVFITAFGNNALTDIIRELGGVAIFNKPFALDELLKVVRETLG